MRVVCNNICPLLNKEIESSLLLVIKLFQYYNVILNLKIKTLIYKCTHFFN